MIRPLILALALALAAPVQAGENAYPYTRVVVDTPKSCVSPCHVTLTFTLPEPGIMQPPSLGNCHVWVNKGRADYWDGVPVVLDHHVGLVAGPSVLAQGLYTWVLSDADPEEREQRICARFSYVPLRRLYQFLERE